MKLSKKNNSIYTYLILALLLCINQAGAQNFQGVATYRSDRDVSDMNFQSDEMTPEVAEMLKAQLKKQFQKDYELTFNLSESVWKEAESLDAGAATASSGGIQMKISVDAGVLYKNTQSKTLLQQTESFSKLFLISSELEERKWQITGKSKTIGNYKVLEAIYDEVSESTTLSLSGDEQTTETRMDTTRYTVWYTPDIPVSSGPEQAWGLPGLILEYDDGSVTYLCTKIVLNPEKGVEIKIPQKGKKVTEEEFEAISEQKMEEMMKKYNGGGEDDGERRIIIRN